MGTPRPNNPESDRTLVSWKEIAAWLGHAERTVKRWERERGLPVHRVPGGKRGGVFAYTSELQAWLLNEQNQELIQAADGPEDVPAGETPVVPAVAGDAGLRANLRIRRKLGKWAAWVAGAALIPGLVAAALVTVSLERRAPWTQSKSRARASVAAAARMPVSGKAEDFYLKGRYYWEKRTPDDLNRAVDDFTQAIVQDPNYAKAYLGLADCYNLLREFGALPPDEAYPRALAAAQRAVELDSTSAEAHTSLAFVTFWWSWQGATAEREFQRALQLDPGLVRAHHWYATYLLARGRRPEALDQIEQARRLEPSSSAILADKGLILWLAGRREEGATLLEQLEKAQPQLSSTHDYLGRVYWEQRQYANALKEWQRQAELRHDQAGMAIAIARGKGYAAGGLKGMWESELPLQKEFFLRGSVSAF
ncbi:MAG TPA: tetratricopeptide repeat protein, partial [Acidobacteriaceae bacterium]|nr:tetratricopeptide repeat protein [Acidobacteriaceae bacterium]